MEDKLTPFYKSEPVPESVSLNSSKLSDISPFFTQFTLLRHCTCVSTQNDGDVKIVVGKNLDLIVFDETKDVLLEV